jgi:hypothetical protein
LVQILQIIFVQLFVVWGRKSASSGRKVSPILAGHRSLTRGTPSMAGPDRTVAPDNKEIEHNLSPMTNFRFSSRNFDDET